MKTTCVLRGRIFSFAAAAAFVLSISPMPALHAATVSGADVYKARCAACHDNPGATRAPSRDTLGKMPATRILRTLDFGLMMGVAYPLKREERDAVAKYLGTSQPEAPLPSSAFCPAGKQPLLGSPTGNWNGWSPDASNARWQASAAAGLTAAQVGHLALKWVFAFPGDVTAFASPTVLNGTVFVGSAGGTVQALDAQTGCVHWVFQANGPVRSALLAVPRGTDYSLVFGDQIGWGYSLDARNGKMLWRRRLDEHDATRPTRITNAARFAAASSRYG
jgi:polyvinyl alcohol dehydrogenase (cytochrome)